MKTNFLFYILHLAMSIIIIVFTPLPSMMGMAFCAAIAALIPMLIAGRHQKNLRPISENWVSTLGCSVFMSVVLTALFTAKAFVYILAVSITGSPHATDDLQIEKLVAIWLFTSVVATACVFFAYDFIRALRNNRN